MKLKTPHQIQKASTVPEVLKNETAGKVETDVKPKYRPVKAQGGTGQGEVNFTFPPSSPPLWCQCWKNQALQPTLEAKTNEYPPISSQVTRWTDSSMLSRTKKREALLCAVFFSWLSPGPAKGLTAVPVAALVTKTPREEQRNKEMHPLSSKKWGWVPIFFSIPFHFEGSAWRENWFFSLGKEKRKPCDQEYTEIPEGEDSLILGVN